MFYTEKQRFYTESVDELAREVARLSLQVRAAAWEKALAKFKLMEFTRIETIPKDQGYFKYTPKMRDYVLADKSNPASCDSTPSPVRMASGKPFRGDTELIEKPYEICLTDCDADLAVAVEKGETAVAAVLLESLYHRFWYGNPMRGQFGLTNHPMVKQVESAFEWGVATNNQIAQQLLDAMEGMNNPVVIVAQSAYRLSIGASDESQSNTGCTLRGNCITAIIQGQEGNTFAGVIKSSRELNERKEFGDKPIAIVYDADSVFMTASDVIYLDVDKVSSKKVSVNRMVNTGGMHVEYDDSIVVITGI